MKCHFSFTLKIKKIMCVYVCMKVCTCIHVFMGSCMCVHHMSIGVHACHGVFVEEDNFVE